MLTDNQLLHVKRQAGIKMILELGLAIWYSDEYLFGDTTEILSNTVHDEVMNVLTYRWPNGQIAYNDVILDQEWEMTRALSSDLQKVAQLYFEGKITMEMITR